MVPVVAQHRHLVACCARAASRDWHITSRLAGSLTGGRPSFAVASLGGFCVCRACFQPSRTWPQELRPLRREPDLFRRRSANPDRWHADRGGLGGCSGCCSVLPSWRGSSSSRTSRERARIRHPPDPLPGCALFGDDVPLLARILEWVTQNERDRLRCVHELIRRRGDAGRAPRVSRYVG